MTDICSKHGPYSVLCRACDYEAEAADMTSSPTPEANRAADVRAAEWLETLAAARRHVQGYRRMQVDKLNGFQEDAVALDDEIARLETALAAAEARTATLLASVKDALTWNSSPVQCLDRIEQLVNAALTPPRATEAGDVG